MKLTLVLAATVPALLIAQPAAAKPFGSQVEALSAGALPTSYAQYRRFGPRHHRYGRHYGYRCQTASERDPGSASNRGSDSLSLIIRR